MKMKFSFLIVWSITTIYHGVIARLFNPNYQSFNRTLEPRVLCRFSATRSVSLQNPEWDGPIHRHGRAHLGGLATLAIQ
ncbi:hypothetical protein N7465_009962 [Penicillium sp. CMV-2018d]|nr:hypothetical protein N7465_009962 [Penicillium sp. CMV-2018d]